VFHTMGAHRRSGPPPGQPTPEQILNPTPMPTPPPQTTTPTGRTVETTPRWAPDDAGPPPF
jgi:hypothetical protein